MARNTERDALFTVSIPRDSELLRMLQDDAEGCNLSVAKLIVVRLKDWYMPTGNTEGRPAIQPATVEQQTTTEELAPDPEITETVDEIVELSTIDDNTSAALDAWL